VSETLRFDLLANDRASSVFRNVGDAAATTESRFSKVGRGMANVGRVAATGLAIGVGAGAIALGKMVGEARESERVGKLTEAVIKSTGGAAKVTAEQVGALATAVSNKTGMDDEAIQSGTNMLLTFKNIKNEVDGEFTGALNRATYAAADLSAAGFGSITGSSKMLGKALNDPIAGISALSRAGVTFTQQQKDQITAMTEAGDVAGAQGLILAEVEGQVGGAAAATATNTQRMKNSIGNLGESIGSGLLPTIERFAGGATLAITGVTSAFTEGGLGGAVDYIGQKIGAAVPVIKAKLLEWGQAFIAWVGPMIPPMLAKLGELSLAIVTWVYTVAYPWLVSSLVKWGKAFVEWIGPMIPPALAALAAAGARLFAWLIDTGLPRLLSNLREWGEAFVKWIGPMIPPMLAALAVISAKLSHWVLTDALPRLAGALVKLGVELVQWIGPMIPKALAALAGLGAQLVAWVVTQGIPMLAAKMAEMGTRAGESIREGIANKVGAVLDFLGGLPERMRSALGNLGSLLYSAGGDLVQGLINGIKALAGEVAAVARDMAQAAVDAIKNAIQSFSPSKVTFKLGEFFGEGFAGGIKAKVNAVASAVGALTDKAKEKLQGLKAEARAIADGVASAMTGAFDVGSLGGGGPASAADVERADIAVQRAQQRVDEGSTDPLAQRENLLALQDAVDNLAALRAQAQQNPSDQLAAFAAQAGTFATSLATAAANGVNGTLIAQVAALGPIQGATAAAALAAMDAAQIASVNTSLAAVDAMGVKLGETVLTTTSLPEDIARAQAQVNYLQEIRDDLKNNPRKIEVNVDGALDPNAVAKQIIQLVKQYNKKRGHNSNDFD
jgi:hypothetical protein